jgi:hypothetical protein
MSVYEKFLNLNEKPVSCRWGMDFDIRQWVRKVA